MDRNTEKVCETNRSLRLCQLINDRKIDNEVGAEIRKLLIEGVDINIQDLNRNHNTPLHLATQKCDKICLRLLLKYKPNLQIRNGSDKTAIDIAQNDEMKQLLSSAGCGAVEKKFIREIEFQNLSPERLKCLEADPAFKVLKITCCPNIQIVWDILNEDDFIRALKRSSHLFVIAIETQEDEIKESPTAGLDIKRSIIVQVTFNISKTTKIYHKTDDSRQLIEIKINSTIDEALFNDATHLEAFCNLDLLVQALNSNIFGAFNGSLLDVKLNNDEIRSGLPNYFAEADALCHRFFKLFDEKLTEEELNARVNQTIKFPGDQSLLALLDLSFETKDEVKLTDDQKRILNFVDSRNYNLIMLAIECNNRDAVKTLLRFSIDLSHVGDESYSASDLCWEKQDWLCLAELIEAGSPYPYNFDASSPSLASSTAFGKIKSMTDAATSFHESIEQGDIEAVKLFITNNPMQKQVYDSTNKSALTVALKSDEAEIYSLLLSERFTPGVDDEYEEIFKSCDFKYDIMEENRKYFKNAFDEPHLIRLLNKYKLSFSSTNREACSQIIQEMFLKLNEIPEMVPILRIVSCSERLNIVFDFDCHSVQEMDPTVGSSSTGLTYRQSGFIYIGAKNHHESFSEVIGTLAHELTHYAMELSYENNCKPYAINDVANHENFESIVNETRKLVQAGTLTDSIISTVFTCYPQERWHQELIVRVPHLLARYKNAADSLKEARHKNYRLFDFFLSKVLPDIECQTKVLMHKLEIRQINSLTGTIEKIQKYKVQIKKSEIKLKDQILGSNAPHLTLGMLHQSLDESSHVFIKIEQIAYGNMREKIGKLEKKDFAIVVDCAEMVKKHEETICNIRHIFMAGKILLVMMDEETSIVTPKLKEFEINPIKHVWSDLTDDSQEVLMQKNVNFQGNFCSFKDLTIKSSNAVLALPLNEFCTTENFEIGDSLSDPFHKFYIPRKFITKIPKKVFKDDQVNYDLDTGAIAMHSDSRPQIEKRIFKSGLANIEGTIEAEKFETVEKSLNEILVESKSTTVVIISDLAGTGKTSTLHEIARGLNKNDPTRWTILTDLKKHIEMFKKIQEEDFSSFQGFLIQIILADKSDFEKQFFTQFYQEGRTNILLDGFDEISPHYKDKVCKALKLFTKKSGNQLWITSRAHLELELEKTLDQLSCSLQPLTREVQIEFLKELWRSDSNSKITNSQENLAIIAEGLLNKLSSICDSRSSFIGLPILISTVAEIYDDPEKRQSIQPEKLSFYSIFKKFVEKDSEIWMKGLAEVERKEILKQSDGIMEVHRKIAIAHLFGDKVADVDVEYDNEQWTVEKLTRFGLIRYDESKKILSFIHETFAEYFLTDFIVGNLRSGSRAGDAVKILVKVLTVKDFQVVRMFLDQALKELNFTGDRKLCETVGKQLNVTKQKASGVLLLISEESYEEVFKFMLYSIEYVDVEGQNLIINKRDEDGNSTLLIIVAVTRKAMTEIFFDFIDKTQNSEFAKITIQALNDKKVNIFHKAIKNENDEIFATLYDRIRKILTTEDIKKMLREKEEHVRSVLHCAVAKGNGNVLNDLVKIHKEVFSGAELKKMFFEVDDDGDTSLHDAAQANNKIALKSFFKHINEILDFDETKKLIQQSGYRQRNIFHSACFNKNEKIFSTLHEYTMNFFWALDIKKMLREKSLRGWSVLLSAAANSNENAMNDLMKVLKELFSNEEMKEMLFEVNKDGNNSLHVAAQENNKIALNCFFTNLEEILNFEETRRFLQKSGFQKRNIFQLACFNKNEEIFPTLHEYTIKFLKDHEIKKMLTDKAEDEWSVLQLAAARCNENALIELMKILKLFFNSEDMKSMLFEVNKYGNTCLHAAAQENNKIALKTFFKYLNLILGFEETKKLIQQNGNQKRNIFHLACFNKNEDIFHTLHECTIKFLEEHEIKKMLRDKVEGGWSVLDLATINCNENAMNDLLGILKRYFSNDEIKEIKSNIVLGVSMMAKWISNGYRKLF